MIKEGKFGTLEAISLSTLVLTSKIFYTSIRVIIKTTATAAWYTTLISCFISVFLFLLVSLLMRRFPSQNLVEIFDAVMGKFIGKILSLVFVAYFIVYCAADLREFVEMLKSYILPYTQPSIIIAVFLLVVLAYAYIGIEGIARMSYISFFIVIIGLFTIFLLPYKIYNFNNLAPLGGLGFQKTLGLGALRSSAYSEVIFLAFIINCLGGVKEFKKVGLISILLTGFIVCISIICSLLAFEYPQASENLSSLFQLSRVIYLGRFFQRVESIFIFIWVIASIITVSTGFYVAVSIFCKTFNITKYRPCLLPFFLITFTVTLLPKNLFEASEIYIKFVRQYSVFITYLIPIIVLFVSLIRGKEEEKSSYEKT